MKLTDDRIKYLLGEDRVVILKRGMVTMALTKDCYENVLKNLGDMAGKMDWELVTHYE